MYSMIMPLENAFSHHVDSWNEVRHLCELLDVQMLCVD